MLTPWEFLTDLTNPLLAFLPRALLVSVLAAVVCGVVGTHVVLRGMAFVGDAVSHAVFPGLAVAFLTGGSLLLGGLIAGVATAVLVTVFSQNRRVSEQSVVGVFFTAAFALGIVIISKAPGYSGSLTSFLFGSISGVPATDVYVVAGATVLIVGAVLAIGPQLVAVSFERETARALGLPVFLLDLALYLLVTFSVVISIRTIGNILVLALLVTPAATARLLTERLAPMMLASAGFGAGAAVLGIYLSWSLDLPAGGTIVLVSSALFFVAWVGAPRHGWWAGRVKRGRGGTSQVSSGLQ
ncbi:Manganese transport system membrane protein MntB [Austwickia sp. TVS 96-490-7B]|uniref:anchored repeat-type ABC transporter permease subunit n=1 Tax=Austwickia sp. TVS 96-490-7B TaxID=2830843 RepID=UPI001C57C797|nr:anchored repeat-type ABC transporter permease subunit [Austwickia sp. TVS 96-490-7B]MBW3085276.1 Manganese transport system membrane protein MntB [Austwickia sp. TVS 96-490-7B]